MEGVHFKLEGIAKIQSIEQEVTVHLQYMTDDPYAVHMSVFGRHGEVAEWEFARELILDALESDGFFEMGKAVGDGDITLWTHGEDFVMLLNPPGGAAQIRVDLCEVDDFMEASAPMVFLPDCRTAIDDAMDTFLTSVLEEG